MKPKTKTPEIPKEQPGESRRLLINFIGQVHLLPGLGAIRVEGIIAKHIGSRDYLAHDRQGRFIVSEAELRLIVADLERARVEGQRLDGVLAVAG